MHSSRVRTVHCSIRLGAGCLPGGVCLGVSAQGVSAQGGVCLGVSAQGVSAQGGVCAGGCLPRGVSTPPPLLTEFLTQACENITFPQLLLRTVMKKISEHQLGPIYQFDLIDRPHSNFSMPQCYSILPTFLVDLTFPSPWFRCPYLSWRNHPTRSPVHLPTTVSSLKESIVSSSKDNKKSHLF